MGTEWRVSGDDRSTPNDDNEVGIGRSSVPQFLEPATCPEGQIFQPLACRMSLSQTTLKGLAPLALRALPSHEHFAEEFFRPCDPLVGEPD